MRDNKIKLIALNGVVGALYAILTLINPMSYGALQFRLSTMLLPLSIYVPQIKAGFVIGTAIANINSSLGIIDVVVGSIITAIAVYLVPRTKNKILMSLLYSLESSILVALELYYCFKMPILYNIITIGISGFILYTIGLSVTKQISKPINKYMI